ncbi:MAG: LPS export ABC transporter permease LptG [Pseudomonadota bacterium]
MIGAIADRHIGRTAIAGMGIALLALLGLYGLFTLIAELGDVGRGNYGVADAIRYVVLLTPQQLVNLFPTAAVVGALLGVGGMAAAGEIVAYRAAGLSRLRIALAVVLSGAVLLLPVILIAELIGPAGERMGRSMRLRLQISDVALASDAGLWVRDGQRVIHARRPIAPTIDPTEPVLLADIDVFEFSEGRMLRATRAESGVYVEGNWELRNLRRSRLDGNRVVTEEKATEVWPSLIAPEQIRAAISRPQALSVAELKPYIDYLSENGLNARPYTAALWAKLAYPLSTLVVIFAATPFLFHGVRATSVGSRLFVGILLGIGFFLINRWAGSLAQVYSIAPAVAALTPSALFAGISTWALRRGT